MVLVRHGRTASNVGGLTRRAVRIWTAPAGSAAEWEFAELVGVRSFD